MDNSDYLYLLINTKTKQKLLFYWHVDEQYANRVILSLNDIFYNIYEEKMPLLTWQTILTKIFKAVDFTKVLPVLTNQYYDEAQEFIHKNQATPIFNKFYEINHHEQNLVNVILIDHLDEIELQPNFNNPLTDHQLRQVRRLITGGVLEKS